MLKNSRSGLIFSSRLDRRKCTQSINSAWLILHSELRAYVIKSLRNQKPTLSKTKCVAGKHKYTAIFLTPKLSICQALKTTFLIYICKIAETGQGTFTLKNQQISTVQINFRYFKKCSVLKLLFKIE